MTVPQIDPFERASSFIRQHNFRAALPLFRAIAEDVTAPNTLRAAALNNLGQICERLPAVDGGASVPASQDSDQKALICYREALRFHPDSPEILCNFGQKIKDLGHFDDSYTAQARARELRPESPLIEFRYGLICLLLGDFETGWDCYDARLRL
jgi:tetratricopeptide (TPR) repeat protein